MSYRLVLRRAAQRGLDAIAERDYGPIARAISSLPEIPRPPRVKKLVGSDLWRIRVGRHRVVYNIDDETRLITIIRVARRREGTYRGL